MVHIACLDVGSTFTKGVLVSNDGHLMATASHRTTVTTDVLDGIDTVLAELAEHGAIDEIRVCSSAGGGLRLAVVGHERAVSAQAGFRVGLSAGAKVVHVAAGLLDRSGVRDLRASRPDLVLVVGGTDGGDEEVLRHNSSALARSGPRVPYVVAGNTRARDEVTAELVEAGRTAIPTDNVIPRIGVMNPAPARTCIRELFVSHVIGGKGLSRGPRFARMVSGATPDIVLRAVELLADGTGSIAGVGDVVVVDVGGATTDVYSVVSPDPVSGETLPDDVAGMWRAARTVEGDLGMRWSAPGVVEAAERERLDFAGFAGEADGFMEQQAQLRHDDVGWIPASGIDVGRTPASGIDVGWIPASGIDVGWIPASGIDVGRTPASGDVRDQLVDGWIARACVTVAVRRHARSTELPSGERTAPRDLRRVALVVGSGGVLRHAHRDLQADILSPLVTDGAGGWLLPSASTRICVDQNAVLGAAGLLAPDRPDAALTLMHEALLT